MGVASEGLPDGQPTLYNQVQGKQILPTLD